MQHCSESVQAYEKLAADDQHAFLQHFIQVEAKNTLKALLISCVRLRSWHLLHEALQESEVREVLWVVIDDLLSLAHGDGTESTLLENLPDCLSDKEGRIAMVFPCRIASWSLAEGLMSKGALPGKETFLRAFSAYQDQTKNPFEYKLLTASMGSPEFDWQEILGFTTVSTSQDILKRSKTSSKPAYIACALALMSDIQKAACIERLCEDDNLAYAYPHITISGSWMLHLSAAAKGKFLSDDMGL